MDAFAALEGSFALGDWIPGLGAHVRNLRIGVKQEGIEKRKGYCLIYVVDLETSPAIVAPILFKYRPEMPSVPPEEIANVLREMVKRQAELEAHFSPPNSIQ
jgi:hypothetical protein